MTDQSTTNEPAEPAQIKDAQRKRKVKRIQSFYGKMPPEMRIQMVADHIVYGLNWHEPFTEQLTVAIPDKSSDNFLYYRKVNDQNEVEQVSREFIQDAIIKWCRHRSESSPELLIKPATAVDIFKQWRAVAPTVAGVKPFDYKSGTGPTLKRLWFDPDDTTDFSDIDINCPLMQANFPILELFSRCDGGQQLAAFIGSIFYPEVQHQQYLYLWGEGSTGKSTLTRLLSSILGTACHFDTFDDMQNRFWTSAFVDRQLLVFPDTNAAAAMQSGLFKQLTGGDPLRIEVKNAGVYSKRFEGKVIITSNFAPVIKSDVADQRRIIVVKVNPFRSRVDLQHEKLLADKSQIEFMINFCRWTYRRMCPNFEQIPVNAEQHEEQIINADEDLEQLMISNLYFSPIGVASIDTIKNALGNHYNANKVARLLKETFKCTKLRKIIGVFDGKEVKKVYYVGVCRKSFDSMDFNAVHAENQRNADDVRDTAVYKNVMTKNPT